MVYKIVCLLQKTPPSFPALEQKPHYVGLIKNGFPIKSFWFSAQASEWGGWTCRYRFITVHNDWAEFVGGV